MRENSKLLKKFISEKIFDFSVDGSTGRFHELPDFEIYPREYLRFAEQELSSSVNTENLINCISHLKRALECQMDILLHSFGLLNVFKKRNLGIDKKLEFLQEARVATSRTLTRLNTIRNKMEHTYERPKLQDIEVYFDLVTSFVLILERAKSFATQTELDFALYKESSSNSAEDIPYGVFSIKYDYEHLKITVYWSTECDENTIIATIKDIPEFAYFFRVFILLSQLETFPIYDDVLLNL